MKNMTQIHQIFKRNKFKLPKFYDKFQKIGKIFF